MSDYNLDREIEEGLKRSEQMIKRQKNLRIVLSVVGIFVLVGVGYGMYLFGTHSVTAQPPIYVEITAASESGTVATLVPVESQIPTSELVVTAPASPQIFATEGQTSQLVVCKEPKSETCYYPANVQNGILFITLWIKDFDKTRLPYITIGTTRFLCALSSSYPDISISCNHAMISSRTWDISLFSSEGYLLSSGSIDIDVAVPTPTKRPKQPRQQLYP